MRVRWFGNPWPTAADRAPICEEQYRAEIPAGTLCFSCGEVIPPWGQGVVMAASPGMKRSFKLAVDGHIETVVAADLECFLYEVLGYNRTGKEIEPT